MGTDLIRNSQARRKRISNIFGTILIVGLPVIFLAAVELALRLAGTGNDLDLFIPSEHQPGYLTVNQEAGRRFFPGSDYGSFGTEDMFAAHKHDSTLRIVALGGSTTAGYPYMYSGTFPAMLKQRLEQAFPDYRIEMINLGMTAVTSYTVLDFAREALTIEPDLFVIYMGHNEFYGVLGSASTRRMGNSRWLTQAYLRMTHLRLFQGLRGMIKKAGEQLTSPGNTENRTLMARMVGDQAIEIGSDLYAHTLEVFGQNLRAVIRLAKSADIPIVVGTPASNLKDQPPFISISRTIADETAITDLLDRAEKSLAQSKFDDAGASIQQVLRIDSLYAAAWFINGKIRYSMQDFEAARLAFQKARDYDGLRFRAPTDFEHTTRLICGEEGAYLAETARLLSENSAGGITGNEVLLEHLHPNLHGYSLLADGFAQSILGNSILTATEAVEIPSAHWFEDRIAVTELDLKMAEYRIRILTSGWPFNPLSESIFARDIRPENELETIAVAVLSGESNYEKAHVELAEYYLANDEVDAALEEFSVLATTFPVNESPIRQMGRILVRERRFGEALPYLKKAAGLSTDSYSEKWAGTILLEQGEYATARVYLRRAVEINPRDHQARFNLAGALYYSGHADEALEQMNQLLRMAPKFPDAQQFRDQLVEIANVRSDSNSVD